MSGHKTLELLKASALKPDRCVIIVTHDSRIYPFADRIVQMDDGLGGEFKTVSDALTLNLIFSGLQQSRFYRIKYAARNIIYDAGNMF